MRPWPLIRFQARRHRFCRRRPALQASSGISRISSHLSVRTKDKAEIIQAAYPDVKVVLGDNDSADIIEREVSGADVVFRR